MAEKKPVADERLPDEAKLRRYLLGRCPVKEASEIELSIFGERAQPILDVVEDELIEDYITGELDGSDRSHFELRLLRSQALAAKIRLSATLLGRQDVAEGLGARVAALKHTSMAGRDAPIISSHTNSWWETGWKTLVPLPLVAWLYASILAGLVLQWIHDPNFSHGFFVPLFALFVLWQDRKKLKKLASSPSWSGLLLVVLSLLVLVIGVLGSELFLSRASLLILLAGLVFLFQGGTFFRAVLFPWAFLVLMIPIPTIVFNQITFPLQSLAWRVAATALPLFGVPVLRQGNVINLPAIALEADVACSGIRSLMSLLTLAIIYGYLLEKRLWVRWFLALASVPITVAANDVRIVGTGLLAQYWDHQAAAGYFHASGGLIIFVISLVMLYALHALIRLLFPEKVGQSSTASAPAGTTVFPNASGSTTSFVLATVLIASAAIFLHARAGGEVFPPRMVLKQFPTQFGDWTSTDVDFDPDTLEVLGPGDFLYRVYQERGRQGYIDLFIAYFPSQRASDTIHSPQRVLPGSGWTSVENQRITLTVPGHVPFPANRYLIAKGDSRQLVLYWFWAHDRGVASEYWAKYYLVKDSLQMNRSDAALVRITTPLSPGETAEEAQQRVFPLVSHIVPLLNDYVPR
jgi:exosortase D (VPLPA-CTERM-specific)